MIHLVLIDLRRPADEVFRACLHLQGLILHLDSLVSLTLTETSEKRQTAFLGVVRPVLIDDFWIEHYRVCRNSPALAMERDDLLAYADHISTMPIHLCVYVRR